MAGRDAAGTPRAVERGTQPGRLPSLRAGRGTPRARTGRSGAHDGHGAANSPPDRAQTAEGRARRRWNAGGEPLRERTLDAGPRERALPLPNGSARDRRDGPGGVPKAAARPIFEQKPFLLRKRSVSCASNYSQKTGFCASPTSLLHGRDGLGWLGC